MKTEQLDPLRILQSLILEIGVDSTGWGVDILVNAMSYLAYQHNPAAYLEMNSVKGPGGITIVMSTVDCWVRNVPRTISSGNVEPVHHPIQ